MINWLLESLSVTGWTNKGNLRSIPVLRGCNRECLFVFKIYGWTLPGLYILKCNCVPSHYKLYCTHYTAYDTNFWRTKWVVLGYCQGFRSLYTLANRHILGCVSCQISKQPCMCLGAITMDFHCQSCANACSKKQVEAIHQDL